MTANSPIQFLGSELRSAENLEDFARFQIIPCPMEKTVSYGSGTALGPDALLEASQELERSSLCEDGIFTHPPIDCSVAHSDCLAELQFTTQRITSKNKLPVTLGGEHSLTWAAIRGISNQLQQKVGIIQIDAHADLRKSYGGNDHSHASVMNLLVEENYPLASFGVRAICEEEKAFRLKNNIFFMDGEELVRKNISSVVLPEDFPEWVYLSFDLDGLDPSIMPGVGTPVPGGLGYYQSIDIVKSALAGKKCVGIDMVELAPSAGELVSPFTAASILQRILDMV
jgi:agmatinase